MVSPAAGGCIFPLDSEAQGFYINFEISKLGKKMKLQDPDDPKLFELQADICQTLANPKRLQILCLLRGGEKSVTALSEALGIAKPNLSQHLAIMRQKGILATRREGTTVYYRLATPRIMEACRIMRQVLYDALVERGALAAQPQEAEAESLREAAA